MGNTMWGMVVGMFLGMYLSAQAYNDWNASKVQDCLEYGLVEISDTRLTCELYEAEK